MSNYFKHKFIPGAIFLLLSSIALSGCGGGDNSSLFSPTAPAPAGNNQNNPLVNTTPQKQLSIAVVLDTAGENDKGFNGLTLKSARKVAEELKLKFDYAVSTSSNEYEDYLNNFSRGGVDLIITVGSLLGEATAKVAKAHREVYFVIVDVAYDNYSELANVTSLTFAEDEAGYLAGVLAGCVTQTKIIGLVAGLETSAVSRFVKGFQNGAKQVNAFVMFLNQSLSDLDDPVKGRQYGESFILQGADVIFGVGGQTGIGALTAASQGKVKAIGVNVDQYLTLPEEVKRSLMTSAMKKVEVATEQAIQDFVAKQLKTGIRHFTVADGGVGLAPYHDWEDKIEWSCKQKVEEARQGLVKGTIGTGIDKF